jgi:translation initiation factor eIF-2B subunit gamma
VQYVVFFIQEFEDITVHILVCDDFMGSATVLLKIKDRIKNHLIVMSGDLIVEDQFLHLMADLHRAKDAAVTILSYKEQAETSEDSKGKPAKPDVIDYLGVDPKDDRLVLVASSNDLENSEQYLKIRKSQLKRFPNFTLHTDLRDAHFYMFSKWTLDVLEQNKQMIQSIKSHFIPFLVKNQFSSKKKSEMNIPTSISEQAYDMSTTLIDPDDRLKCYMWKLDHSAYCARVSNFESYMKINREIASGEKHYLPAEPKGTGKHKHFVAASAQVSTNTQVTSGCVVGDFTHIGDRVGVKKSIIGKHCKIADNVKISNSIILDHVHIGEGAKIQNAIIGPNSYIDPQASLTECQLGEGCHVPTGRNITGRHSKNAL